MIGTILDGKYRLIRLLGQGGMGTVYEAEHTGTGERVAVKVIYSGSRRDSTSLITRFQREARAAAAIETEHIVKVLDSGTDQAQRTPYIAMEYLEGEDLAQLLERVGPLPPLVALRIAAQACVGLQKAHAAGVMHRDIKPANLFLAESDDGAITVKILDFGIAKIKRGPGQGKTTGLTAEGSMLGSPLYMSPEQVESTKTIDNRTDIWSLGAVLYATLAGRAPHGDLLTIGRMLVALCTELPRLVQELAPWVPAEVAAVVHGALQFDVADRFQSAAAMSDAIKPLLPGGFRLRKDELTALTEAERGVVAAKLQMAGVSTSEAPLRVVLPSVPAPATSAKSAGKSEPAPPPRAPGAVRRPPSRQHR